MERKTEFFGTNVYVETAEKIHKIFSDKKYQQAISGTAINLSEKSILVRLALLNLRDHFPTDQELKDYKAALLRPDSFDDGWNQKELTQIV